MSSSKFDENESEKGYINEIEYNINKKIFKRLFKLFISIKRDLKKQLIQKDNEYNLCEESIR